MKIRINDVVYDDVICDNRVNTLDLYTKTEDVTPIIKDVLATGVVEVLGDDDVVTATIKGKFTNVQIAISGEDKYITIYKKVDSPEEVVAKRLDEQNQVISIVFVQMAQDGNLDDVTISEHPTLFPEWDENWTGKAGTILREGDSLYRSIHDITSVAQNTKPSETPSMWTRIADPAEEYPEWVQPIGAHDAYSIGDKVSHLDKHWVSTTDGNTWQPGVYGWDEITA
jgi:hypothetical protein